MKKIMKALLVVLIAVGLATPASAAGAITADEQRILDELNQGVTVSGKRFNLPKSDITKAENHLKTEDVPVGDVNKIVANIKEARGLIEATNIQASSGSELRDKLPNKVYARVVELVNDSFAILGLSGGVDEKGASVVNKSTGKELSSTGSIVKTTGANYSTSLIVFASLMLTALAAAFVGKKYTKVA